MATLTTKITESVTINGKAYGNTVTETTTGVNDVSEAIVSISTAEATVLDIVLAKASIGSVVQGNLKYIRITNKSTVNFINITLNGNGVSDKAIIKLKPSQSFILNNDEINFGSGYIYLDNITLSADTAVCDCEFFIATA